MLAGDGRIAGDDGSDAQQPRQLPGRYLAVAVHEHDQRLPAVVLHDQGFNHAMLVYPETGRAVGGSAAFLIAVEMAGEIAIVVF